MKLLKQTPEIFRPAITTSLRGRPAGLLVVLTLAALILAARLASSPVYAMTTDEAFSPAPPLLTDPILRLDPSLVYVVLNDSFTIDLWVDDASNLGGWEVDVVFDPARLEISQVTPGGFLSDTGRTEASLQHSGDAPGRLSIGGYSYGMQPVVTGSGVLAHITLRALAAGETSLTLEDALLAKIEGPGNVQGQTVATQGATVSASPPLGVTMASFRATPRQPGIAITWETVDEIDNVGFTILRSQESTEPGTPVAFVPSQAPGSSQGFAYEWLDSDVTAGETYHYWLEAIDTSGATSFHGPVSATFQAPSAVTVNGVQAAAGAPGVAGWWVFAAVLGLLAGTGMLVKRR
jgi:hypothetical protein